MDVNMVNVKTSMESKWVQFGRSKKHETTEKVMELMNSEKYKLAARSEERRVGKECPV